MSKVKLPYVQAVKSKGKAYYYFRKGSVSIRIPGNPDTEEFQRTYWKIRSGKYTKPSSKTWRDLITHFYDSAQFHQLSAGSKSNYRRHCEAILENNASKTVASFTREHAEAVQSSLKHQWSKANERMAVLSILLNFAISLNWISKNPASGFHKLKGSSFEAWPNAMLKAYEAYCTEHNLQIERLIYEIAIGSGQRLGDCLKMKWSDIEDGFMSVTQEKTDTRLSVYIPNRLQTYLDQVDRKGEYIFARGENSHLSKSQVQKKVNVVREAIGAKKKRLVIHGWRYTAAKQLADAGNSVQEIQSVTGHTTLEMILKYTKQADKKAASQRAQTRRTESIQK